MTSRLKHFLPRRLRQALTDRLARKRFERVAYSQEGEDLVLARLFDGRREGVYVDVGAHHPFRFSNTCLLFQQGWRGINIDAMPGSMRLFDKFRPRDINLEIGVSSVASELEFFIFEETALNTFDRNLAEERTSKGWPLKERRSIRCLPLADVLDEHLPKLGAPTFDLLTIDVEGLDLQVLRSNDWSRYRPRALAIEALDLTIDGIARSETGRFCSAQGYSLFAKLHHTAIFTRD